MLCLRNFGYRIGYTSILQKVNLELYPREMVCLLGPNGAGKSTLLSSLCSPQPIYEGNIFFQGIQLRKTNERKDFLRQCAYLGHEPGLFYDLSVEENLSFFLKILSPYPQQNNRQSQKKLLELVGLEEYRQQRVRLLSRGFKQRLSLLRIFLHDPKIIFMDEPLTALDLQGILIFQKLLERSIKKGSTALIATHEENFFIEKNISTRFLFLKRGRLIADIPAERYNKKARAQVKKMLFEL